MSSKKASFEIFTIVVLLSVVSFLLTGCGSAPQIPHSVEGRDNCVVCHGSGAGGAPISPHPDRNNCIGCHKPVSK